MLGFEFLLNFSWIITLVFICAVLAVPIKFKAFFTGAVIILNAVCTSWLAIPALNGNVIDYSIFAGSFLGTIPIRIDGLSAWFILIINFTSITGLLYGTGYLKAYSNSSSKLSLHWILYILFHLSMVWVCMLQNGIAFLIAWEIMSLSSLLLVIFDHNNQKTLKAGINYLVQMHISVVLLTVGFILVYFKTGSFDFEAIGSYFNSNNNILLFFIFFIGFGLKAGFIPLHTWLPHAHPAAPSHISGVMSGVIVKLGIYGIFRVITFLKFDFLLIGEIVLIISVLSGLYGILNAAVVRDFKKMLAYCTIENIGIIGMGMGIGLMGIGNGNSLLYYLGFGGALLHVLNHSLFKSLLFYSAGSVYQQTHTRNMDKLGGLIKSMPKTAVIFLIGAIAIGGIPPFNGFISEFIIYSGLIEGIKTNSISQIIVFVLSFTTLSIIGGMSILTFTKAFGTIFLGNEREISHPKPKEVSIIMLLPQYLIIVFMLSIAFVPGFYLNLVGEILNSFFKNSLALNASVLISYSATLYNISICSALFVGIILLFLGIRLFVIRNKEKIIQPTWGCAYVAPNSKMQYSGKSFSKTMSKIFNFFLIEKKNYRKIDEGEIFPMKRKYESNSFDFFEFRLFDNISHRLVYSANYFKFIQNGRVQSYVLYGIIFILAIFLITVFNLI
jgi:formate hydrogenlyase subunit 3/multisubunit Na+/H+ antiporter MnhD subunit